MHAYAVRTVCVPRLRRARLLLAPALAGSGGWCPSCSTAHRPPTPSVLCGSPPLLLLCLLSLPPNLHTLTRSPTPTHHPPLAHSPAPLLSASSPRAAVARLASGEWCPEDRPLPPMHRSHESCAWLVHIIESQVCHPPSLWGVTTRHAGASTRVKAPPEEASQNSCAQSPASTQRGGGRGVKSSGWSRVCGAFVVSARRGSRRCPARAQTWASFGAAAFFLLQQQVGSFAAAFV
jgi:hypothetical protein